MEPARLTKKILIHIGRPDDSRPHRDMSLMQSFIKANPEYAIVIIVDSEKDHLEMGEKVQKELFFPPGHPGGFIIHWVNDGGLIDLLCSKMVGAITWKVVGNGWYTCENGHESSQTHAAPRENCPTCEAKVTITRADEARVEHFGKLLSEAVSLMNFDTRSGVALNALVNPDSNVIRNMKHIVGCKHEKAPLLKDFKGKGAGKPSLCISAGPSLDDELDNIKRLQDSHIICCVGRVYKKLRAHGIRVDYTMSCEMFEWDAAIFADLTDVGETVLCYPGVVAPATLDNWPGKMVCMMDPALAVLSGEGLAISGGNSVSHHMLNFTAEILECEPIILVGQDLAYTKPGLTHAKGSEADKWPDDIKAQDAACHNEIEWAPSYGKGGRFHPETHRQSVYLSGGFAPVGDMEVMTSKPYRNFATLFSILIARHGKKVFNSCGEGLKIDGAEYVNLSEVK